MWTAFGMNGTTAAAAVDTAGEGVGGRYFARRLKMIDILRQ